MMQWFILNRYGRRWLSSHDYGCDDGVKHGRTLTNTITALTSRVCRMYRASIPMLRPRNPSRTPESARRRLALGRRSHLRFHLTFDEGEQIGVHLFGVSDCYTVRATWVNLKNCVRDDRWYAAARWADRHDLVVFAMDDE